MQIEYDGIKLRKLSKLWVAGDFDGDGENDTIFQHNFSRLKEREIEYAADPYQHEWDSVISWFYDQKSDVYLSMKGNDILRLGPAQGYIA